MAFNFNLATGPIFGVHYNQRTLVRRNATRHPGHAK